MIFRVTLLENDASTALEVIHVRADTIVDAIAKAERYGQKEWSTACRVGAAEETDIVIVEDEPKASKEHL